MSLGVNVRMNGTLAAPAGFAEANVYAGAQHRPGGRPGRRGVDRSLTTAVMHGSMARCKGRFPIGHTNASVRGRNLASMDRAEEEPPRCPNRPEGRGGRSIRTRTMAGGSPAHCWTLWARDRDRRAPIRLGPGASPTPSAGPLPMERSLVARSLGHQSYPFVGPCRPPRRLSQLGGPPLHSQPGGGPGHPVTGGP